MAKVLIVDDSPATVFTLKKMVEDWGHEAVTAENGKEALEIATKEQPNVILMDIVLPRLNGFQATRELSKHTLTADIPIILVSTKDQRTDRLWGLRQGAVDYLPKPVENKVLLASVKQAMAGSEDAARDYQRETTH